MVTNTVDKIYVNEPKLKEASIPAVPVKLEETNQPEQKTSTSTDAIQKSAIPEKAIKSNLDIQIKDKDGLLNNSKDDLELKISGTTTVSKDFIVNKLSSLEIKGLKVNTPTFDSERKQYVLSGKALDVFLGIDVGFEIRIGEKDGKLFARVDNGLKRGIIYNELKKELEKLGVEAYKEDKKLFIKPEYGGAIDIPISKDKTQKARVESIDTNDKNTKFSIDKSGNITITLKDVDVKASSDPNKVNDGKKAVNDGGFIKFDFSADNNLKPEVTIKDADLKVNVENQDLTKISDPSTAKQIKEEFGDVKQIEIKDLTGKVELTKEGLDANVKTHIDIATTGDSKLSTDVKVSIDNKEIKEVKAENLDLKAKDNTLTAKEVDFKGNKTNLTLEAKEVKADVKRDGINANLDGDISLKKEGKTLTAEVDGNIKGDIAKKDLSAKADINGKTILTKENNDIKVTSDGKITADITQKDVDANLNIDGKLEVNKKATDINVKLDGNTQGKVNQGETKVDFATSGTHDIKLGKEQIDVNIDKVSATGNIKTPETKENNKKDSKTPNINVNVKETDIKGNLNVKGLDVKTEINNGGINASVSKEKITVESSATIKAEANSKDINGKVELGKTNLEIDNKTKGISVKAENVKADGEFNKPTNGLAVKGKVNGNISANISNGDIKIKEEGGNFDAQFKKGSKIDVQGKGGNVEFGINKNSDVSLKLNDVDAKTKLHLNKNKIDVETKGKEVTVQTKDDDVSISTKEAKSKLNVKINQSIQGSGVVGDVNVKVNSTPTKDTVDIDAKNATLNAHIKNKKDTLGVDVKTTADLKVKVDGDDVTVESKNAKQTKVDFNLNNKIETKADGKNFKVQVKEDKDDENIDITLKKAVFDGKIHPNPKINVNVSGTTKEDLNVSIKDSNTGTNVNVNTKTEIKGDVSVNNKVKSNFSNKNGFEVNVKDDVGKPTEVEAKLKNLNLDGSFITPKTGVGIKGTGDFKFNLKEGAGNDPDEVNVNYEGNLSGDVNAQDVANGNYAIKGNFNVNSRGDQTEITTVGGINAKTDKTKFGINTEIDIEGTKEDPLKISIDDTNDTKVSVKNKKGGFINLNNIEQLNLGKDDSTVQTILETLKSKSAKVAYQNLAVSDNGNKVSVNVQTREMDTKYGSFNSGMLISREGNRVQIEKGMISLDPNMNFYYLVKDELSKKYNIKIEGVPELKNGQLSFTGEIKSKSGITQIAKFNVKATVQDNNLVLDLDNSKVLKVIGQNTVTNVLDKILNRTDIEHARVDKSAIKIRLDDLFKDLSTTAGINFAGIKLEDDRIKIGFNYNKTDQDIAKFAKNKDVSGLKNYIKEVNLSELSGDAISTTFNTIVATKDQKESIKFISDLTNTYLGTKSDRTELEKGLNLVSKNVTMRKANIEDNITLDYLKQIKVKTPEGDRIIKSLPEETVRNLANNLDTTISQGLRLSYISTEERDLANYIRRLKGIPENHRMI
ncbi:MAG: hypothetical protein U0457_07160 [Candidatus Sericytochromatia bacterium]